MNTIINTTKNISAVKPILIQSANSNYGLIISVAGIIAGVIIAILLYKFFVKRKVFTPKNPFFKHLYRIFSTDLTLNESQKYIQIGAKKYKIVAYKKEMLREKPIKILKIKTGILKDKIVFLSDAIEFDGNWIYTKDINFYSIGEYFLIDASIYEIVINYLNDSGLFRISYENILNSLEKSRLSERVVESNYLADAVKTNKENTQNFIEIQKELQAYKKI